MQLLPNQYAHFVYKLIYRLFPAYEWAVLETHLWTNWKKHLTHTHCIIIIQTVL